MDIINAIISAIIVLLNGALGFLGYILFVGFFYGLFYAIYKLCKWVYHKIKKDGGDAKHGNNKKSKNDKNR